MDALVHFTEKSSGSPIIQAENELISTRSGNDWNCSVCLFGFLRVRTIGTPIIRITFDNLSEQVPSCFLTVADRQGCELLKREREGEV